MEILPFEPLYMYNKHYYIVQVQVTFGDSNDNHSSDSHMYNQ